MHALKLLPLVTIFLGVAMVAVVAAPSALAQDFPGKTVRIIVPYPPSGGVDNPARPIAERLRKRWGHPVVIDNKPGAAPQMVVAHPSVGAASLTELVALARAKPNTLSYASYGSGSQPHLLFEGLRAQTGAAITQVPYKGIAPAVTATIAGEVQLTMAGASVARGHIQAGKLKALAIARRERLPILPNVPTLAEAGFGQLDPQPWFSILAPSGTSPEIVKRIRDDVAALFADPEFRERHVIQRGLDPVVSTPRTSRASSRRIFSRKVA